MHGVNSIANLAEHEKDLLLIIEASSSILQHSGQHLVAEIHDQETLFGATHVVHHLGMEHDDVGMLP